MFNEYAKLCVYKCEYLLFFFKLPCKAYLLDLESVANPTLSRTPHLGMLM